MRRTTATLLLLVSLVLLLASCQAKTTSWERIVEEGILRVGLDPTYPPFETAEDGELRGLDVDLVRLIGNKLDLEVQFLFFGYDGLYDALGTGQVDVLASALVIVPERTRDFAYTKSYFNAGERLVSRIAQSINGPEELQQGPLAVELGAAGHVAATEWERQYPDLTVQPHETAALAIEAVVNGAAEAALVDGVSALLHQNDQALYISPQPVTEEPYALVVRAEDQELLAQLNGSLVQMEAEGQLETIVRRWLTE